MAKGTIDAGGSNISVWSETTQWGGNRSDLGGNGQGRSYRTLDPRKRTAPPVGGDIKSKRPKKARSSITPW